MPRRQFHLLLILLATTTISLAYAQEEASMEQLAADAYFPAPVSSFEINAGFRWTREPMTDTQSYTRIAYKGAMVREEGTPFKFAKGLDLAAPVLPKAAGDRNKWFVRYEDGHGALGGSLFEAEGLEPINLRGLERFDLRGVGYVGGDTERRITQFAVGLESKPLRLPFLRDRGYSNWLVIGVNGQRREMTDQQSGDDNLGVVTLRTFLGKGVGWRKSASVAQTAAKLETLLLEQAPTLEKAQTLVEEMKASGASARPTKLQALLIDMVSESTEASWTSDLKAMAQGTADAITDQVTLALYAEISGWSTVLGDARGSRTKGLASLSADYWLLPSRDDVFLRLRYEYGYERALPDTKLNQFTASISMRF